MTRQAGPAGGGMALHPTMPPPALTSMVGTRRAVPMLASGRVPPELVQQGASTMTSADERLAEDSVLFSV